MPFIPLSEPKWYAVVCKPRMELRAATRLLGAGYRAFVPIERVRTFRRVPGSTRRKIAVIDRPLFSRYIFVGLYYVGQGLYGVSNCDAVSRVVTFGGEPLVVPLPVMDALMAADDARARQVKDEVARKPFLRGQTVKVREGHIMADFIAQVSVDAGKTVRAWLEILGARREVEFQPKDLEPA